MVLHDDVAKWRYNGHHRMISQKRRHKNDVSVNNNVEQTYVLTADLWISLGYILNKNKCYCKTRGSSRIMYIKSVTLGVVYLNGQISVKPCSEPFSGYRASNCDIDFVQNLKICKIKWLNIISTIWAILLKDQNILKCAYIFVTECF